MGHYVGSGLVEQDRLVGQRGVEVDHRRQRVVVHVDEFDRVLALIELLGHDDGDRVADKAHDLGGEQWPAHIRVEQERHDRLDDRHLGEGRTGVGGDDAGRFQCRADVDPADPGVRHW